MSDPSTAQPRLRFLAISGNLRSASSNLTLLQAAARLAPDSVAVTISTPAGDRHHFNSDLDGEGAEPPPTVASFRAQIRGADAVLISCPESLHGVPGSLKDALDRIASSGEFTAKPVALINASATSTHAQAALIETMTVLMADLITAPIPHSSNKTLLNVILADAAKCDNLFDAKWAEEKELGSIAGNFLEGN